jgi:hypothetical protein
MMSISLTITPLTRLSLARRWPSYLWGGHDENTANYYTSDAVMTSTPLTITHLRRSCSTPLTITPLTRSWLVRRSPSYLWGGHDENTANYYTPDADMTSTPLTIIPLRRSWRARANHYTSEAVMTSTPLTISPLTRSWLARRWPLYL